MLPEDYWRRQENEGFGGSSQREHFRLQSKSGINTEAQAIEPKPEVKHIRSGEEN